mmetsp:Transcript_48639/g.128658  ORF Transcript_48639/g.128658 Transcript_48639/m.128658 type:complete len:262 (-) Transcript_48639:800-1585(-)
MSPLPEETVKNMQPRQGRRCHHGFMQIVQAITSTVHQNASFAELHRCVGKPRLRPHCIAGLPGPNASQAIQQESVVQNWPPSRRRQICTTKNHDVTADCCDGISHSPRRDITHQLDRLPLPRSRVQKQTIVKRSGTIPGMVPEDDHTTGAPRQNRLHRGACRRLWSGYGLQHRQINRTKIVWRSRPSQTIHVRSTTVQRHSVKVMTERLVAVGAFCLPLFHLLLSSYKATNQATVPLQARVPESVVRISSKLRGGMDLHES